MGHENNHMACKKKVARRSRIEFLKIMNNGYHNNEGKAKVPTEAKPVPEEELAQLTNLICDELAVKRRQLERVRGGADVESVAREQDLRYYSLEESLEKIIRDDIAGLEHILSTISALQKARLQRAVPERRKAD